MHDHPSDVKKKAIMGKRVTNLKTLGSFNRANSLFFFAFSSTHSTVCRTLSVALFACSSNHQLNQRNLDKDLYGIVHPLYPTVIIFKKNLQTDCNVRTKTYGMGVWRIKLAASNLF